MDGRDRSADGGGKPRPRWHGGNALLVLLSLTAAGAAAQPPHEGLFSPPAVEAPVEPAPVAPEPLSGIPDAVDRQLFPSIAQPVAPGFGGATIRRRTAAFDLTRLAQARQAAEHQRDGRIELNLFGDADFTAVGLRTRPTATGYSVSGRLADVPLGTFTLVVNGDVVAGSVRTPRGTFTIRSVGAGRVEIREVDPSKLPPGAPPKVPPQSSRGSASPVPPQAVAGAEEEEVVVDVLAVYTPAAREDAGGRAEIEATIDLWVAETNGAYADSGVTLEVHLVEAAEVDYVEQDGMDADLDTLADVEGELEGVHALRDESGADLVVLVVVLNDIPWCGIAHLLTSGSQSPEPAFSVVGMGCGGRSFAHELGHNMGLLHDRHLDSGLPYKIDPWAHGYVNQPGLEAGASPDSRWITIMAYWDQCADAGVHCGAILRFANPDLEYVGDPMGVPGDEETWALHGPVDARRTLDRTRPVVVGRRPPRSLLVAEPNASLRDLDHGQPFTLRADVRNPGRRGAEGVRVTFHRSPDAALTPEDEEVGAVELDSVAARSSRPASVDLTAPAEHGEHWFGVCVRGDHSRRGRRCASLRFAVGPVVSITDARSTEGAPLEFAVNLSEPRARPIRVEWLATGKSAVEMVDFVGVSGTVAIPAGETRADIVVPTTDDDLAEPEDALAVSLVAVSSADVALSAEASSAAGTIVDDDGPMSIPDPDLRMAIAHQLGRGNVRDAITAEDVAALEELHWDWGTPQFRDEAAIVDLTGLQFATALRTLDLVVRNAKAAPLENLPGLRHLELAGRLLGEGVGSVRPFARLRELRSLGLSWANVGDISALGGLIELRRLNLGYNRISDVSALAGLTKLEVLQLSGNPVSDLSPLAGLTALTGLLVRDASVADVAPLADLPLLLLDLSSNAVADLSPLEASRLSRTLRHLSLGANRLSDISALASFGGLSRLELAGNGIPDIAPLAGLGSLRHLSLSDNVIANVGALSGLTGLDALFLNRNRIADIGPLAGMERLSRLFLAENLISDVGPLSGLTDLEVLDLTGNHVADVSALAGLESLHTLALGGNALTEVEALGELGSLRWLDIGGNRIADLAPLKSLSALRTVYVMGNPLNERSRDSHVPGLRSDGATVFDVGLWLADGSAREGDSDRLEMPVYLSGPVDESIAGGVAPAFAEDWSWFTALESTAGRGDFAWDWGSTWRMPAGAVAAVVAVGSALEDTVDERHETMAVRLVFSDSPTAGVAQVGRAMSNGGVYPPMDAYSSEAFGLVVDPAGPSHDVPVFAAAGDGRRQGFVRVVNRGGRSAAHVEVFDGTGHDHGSQTLTLRRGRVVHFNSEDLAEGNRDKGVHGAAAAGGVGDLRLKLWANDVDVLSYARTPDGFLSSLHDTVPRSAAGGYFVPIFNPGSNRDQVSALLLANPGPETAEVSITGIDDTGASPGAGVSLTLDPGAARRISASDLERGGSGLSGAIGDGSGKWRLLVGSPEPLLVGSLLESPTGHLTNLSTMPDNKRPGEGGETLHHVPLFLSGADPHGRQGFVRVLNRSDEDVTVRVRGIDDHGREAGPVDLFVGAGAAAHFNSHDLEQGNGREGLSGGIGSGEGNWRLEITGRGEIDVLAYMRTPDGFLASLHDTVAGADGRFEAPMFNPGGNRSQVSMLRLANPSWSEVPVTVMGHDDNGVPHGPVDLRIPPNVARTFTAQDLEAGGEGFSGRLGDGAGKWRLVVSVPPEARDFQVVSLLEAPTGHLVNLSTVPGRRAAK